MSDHVRDETTSLKNHAASHGRHAADNHATHPPTGGGGLRVLATGRDTDVDLTPILGEIVRQWQRINPGKLTAPQALRLLGVLIDITDTEDASR